MSAGETGFDRERGSSDAMDEERERVGTRFGVDGSERLSVGEERYEDDMGPVGGEKEEEDREEGW